MKFAIKMNLSSYTQGKDNNFNLIRIVAAVSVMVTHSFVLSIGTSEAEPLLESLGMTLGSFAVDAFFITSGFLVTASLLRRQSWIEFTWARILRIYPALVVMLLCTVFGLGVFFTKLPIKEYLTTAKTYIYFIKCSTLITGISYSLPGVFENNPYKDGINGSLWTMPNEIRMYAILLTIWIILRFYKKIGLKRFDLFIVISAIASACMLIIRHFFFPGESQFLKLFFMFFSGAAYYVLREHIKLSSSLFWFALTALIISAVINKHLFFVIYVLTVSYVLLYVAFIPSGFVRNYNLLGDYSYGVYIYAFPVQQTIAALIPGVSVISMLLISSFITFFLGILSWHFLEKHMLSLKENYIGHTRRIINNSLKSA